MVLKREVSCESALLSGDALYKWVRCTTGYILKCRCAYICGKYCLHTESNILLQWHMMNRKSNITDKYWLRFELQTNKLISFNFSCAIIRDVYSKRMFGWPSVLFARKVRDTTQESFIHLLYLINITQCCKHNQNLFSKPFNTSHRNRSNTGVLYKLKVCVHVLPD